MTTAQEVENWRVKIKKKIWDDFCAEKEDAHGKFLMKKFDELCDTALLGINSVATMEAYAVCAEICQQEATDNGTAQKIEARIRALKE
jgi:hypothetical protein